MLLARVRYPFDAKVFVHHRDILQLECCVSRTDDCPDRFDLRFTEVTVRHGPHGNERADLRVAARFDSTDVRVDRPVASPPVESRAHPFLDPHRDPAMLALTRYQKRHHPAAALRAA